MLKTNLKFNQKEESTMFYFILQSYSTHSPEFTGLKFKIRNKIWIICSFLFSWIWIRNNNSGSRKKFRIQPDRIRISNTENYPQEKTSRVTKGLLLWPNSTWNYFNCLWQPLNGVCWLPVSVDYLETCPCATQKRVHALF